MSASSKSRTFHVATAMRRERASAAIRLIRRRCDPQAEQAHDLDRWLPLVKWPLTLPHYVALIPVALMALVLLVVA